MESLQFFPIARPIADEAMSDLQSEISGADVPTSTFQYKEAIDAAPTKVLAPVPESNNDVSEGSESDAADSYVSSSSEEWSSSDSDYDDVPTMRRGRRRRRRRMPSFGIYMDADDANSTATASEVSQPSDSSSASSLVDGSEALSSEGSAASSNEMLFQESESLASSSSFDDASSDGSGNLSDLSGISELQDILLDDANSDASFGSQSEDELLQMLSFQEEQPTKVLTGSQLDSAFNRFSKEVLTNRDYQGPSEDDKNKSAVFTTYDKKIKRHRLHLPDDPDNPQSKLVPTTFVFAYCAEVNSTDPMSRKYLWAACADQLAAVSEVSATELEDNKNISDQYSYVKRKKGEDNKPGAQFKIGQVMQFLLKDPRNEIKQLKFCDYDDNANKCGSVNGGPGGILLIDEAYVDMLNEAARGGRPPPSQADYERQRENAIQQLQIRRNGPIKKGRLGRVTDMTGAVADILPVVNDEVKPNFVQMDAEKVCQMLNQSTAFSKAEADSCTPENTYGACLRAETMKDGVAAGSECVYTGNSQFPTLQVNVGDLMSVIDLKGGCVDSVAGGGTGDRVPLSKQLNDGVTLDALKRAVGTEYALSKTKDDGTKITAADYDDLPTEVKEALCETVSNPERQKGWVYLRDLHQDAAFAHKEPIQYPATASAELRKRQKQNQAIIIEAKEAIKASLKEFIATSKQEKLQADWFRDDKRSAREKINTHLVKRAADAEWVEKQMRKAELERQENDTSKVRSQSRYINSEYLRLRNMFEERQQRLQEEIALVTGKGDEDQLDKELKSAQTEAIEEVKTHYNTILNTVRRKNPQETVAADEYRSSTLPTVDELTTWVTADKDSEAYQKFQTLVKEAHKALDDTPNTLSTISSEEEESSKPWTPAEEEEELMFSEDSSDASSFASSDSDVSSVASSDHSLSSESSASSNGGWSTLSSLQSSSEGGPSTLSAASNDSLSSVFDSEWNSLNDSALALLHNVLKPSTDMATTELTVDLISGVPTKTKETKKTGTFGKEKTNTKEEDLSINDQQDLALVYSYLAEKGSKMIAVVNAFDSGRIEERPVADERDRLKTLVEKDYSKGSWEKFEDAYSETDTILQRRGISLKSTPDLLSGQYCLYFNQKTLKEELHTVGADGECVTKDIAEALGRPELIQVADNERTQAKGKFNPQKILDAYDENVTNNENQDIPWGSFLRVTRPISRLGKTEFLMFGDKDEEFPFANVLLDAYYFALAGGIYTSHMEKGEIYVAQMPITEVTAKAMSKEGMNVVRPPFPYANTLTNYFQGTSGWATDYWAHQSTISAQADTENIGVDPEQSPYDKALEDFDTAGKLNRTVPIKSEYLQMEEPKLQNTFVVNEAAVRQDTWGDTARATLFGTEGNSLLSNSEPYGGMLSPINTFMRSVQAESEQEPNGKPKLKHTIPAALASTNNNVAAKANRLNIGYWLPEFMKLKMSWEAFWYRRDRVGKEDRQGCRMFGGPRKSKREPPVLPGWKEDTKGVPTGEWNANATGSPCEDGNPDPKKKMYFYKPWFKKNEKDITYAAIVGVKLYVEQYPDLNEELGRPFEQQALLEKFNETFTTAAYPRKTTEDAKSLFEAVKKALQKNAKKASQNDSIRTKAIFVFDPDKETSAGNPYSATDIDDWIANTIDTKVNGTKIAEIMDFHFGKVGQMSISITGKDTPENEEEFFEANEEEELSHSQRLANWDTLLNSYRSRTIGHQNVHPSVVGFEVDDIAEIPTKVKADLATDPYIVKDDGTPKAVVMKLTQAKRPVFPAGDNLFTNNKHLLWVAAEPQDDEENVDTNIVTRKWLHQVYCQIPFLIEAVNKALNITNDISEEPSEAGTAVPAPGKRYSVERMEESLRRALEPKSIKSQVLTAAEKELRKRVIQFRGFARNFAAGREMVRKIGDVHLGDYLIVRHKAMQEWWHQVQKPEIAPLVFGQAQVQTENGTSFDIVSCGYGYHCAGVREDLKLHDNLKETHPQLDDDKYKNAQVCAAFGTGTLKEKATNGDKPPYYAQCGPADELTNVSGVGVSGADLLQAHAIFERLLRRSGNVEDVKYPYSVAPGVASYFAIEALYNVNGSGLEPNDAGQVPAWRERAYSDSDLERIKDTMHAYMRTPGYNTDPTVGRFPAPIGQVYGCYTTGKSPERVETAIVSAMCKDPNKWGPQMPVGPTVDDLRGRAMQPYAEFAAEQMRKLSPFPYGPFEPETQTWNSITNICDEVNDAPKGEFNALDDYDNKNNNSHKVCFPRNSDQTMPFRLKVFALDAPLGKGAENPTEIEPEDFSEDLDAALIQRSSKEGYEIIANPNTSSTRNAPGVYQTNVNFNTMHNKAFKSDQDKSSTFKSGDYTFEETSGETNSSRLATDEKFTKRTRSLIDSKLKTEFDMSLREDEKDYQVKQFKPTNKVYDFGGFATRFNTSESTPVSEVDRLRGVCTDILAFIAKSKPSGQQTKLDVQERFGDVAGFFYTSCDFDASPPAFYLNFVSVVEDLADTVDDAETAKYNVKLIQQLEKLCGNIVDANTATKDKTTLTIAEIDKIIKAYWQTVSRINTSGDANYKALTAAISQERKKKLTSNQVTRVSEIADLNKLVAKFAPADRRTISGVVAADDKVKLYRSDDQGYDPVQIVAA